MIIWPHLLRYRQSIDINMIASQYWTATMEFKAPLGMTAGAGGAGLEGGGWRDRQVRLLDPDGCNLGFRLREWQRASGPGQL